MLPGPTIICKCSTCLKPIERTTIASGNTFGSTQWTDAKRDAPMLPDNPLLVICPHCHALLWINELDRLGEVEYWKSARSKFKDARQYEIPSEEDYFAQLIVGFADLKKERYIRLRAWWAGNDHRRGSSDELPMSSREIENLTAYAQVLDESIDDNLIMKAEAMRELGQFGDALTLLSKSVNKNTLRVARFIRHLSVQGDPYVREIRFDESNFANRWSRGSHIRW